MSKSERVFRVVIADDNMPNCELLDAYLAEDQYEIAMAHDGAETLKVVGEFEPDLVLLDIMMPKLSGFEVCRKLKQEAKTASIPVLMVTALREAGDIERAVEAGADDFLSKPIHRVELLTRVRSLLKLRFLESERERLLAYIAEIDRKPDHPTP